MTPLSGNIRAALLVSRESCRMFFYQLHDAERRVYEKRSAPDELAFKTSTCVDEVVP